MDLYDKKLPPLYLNNPSEIPFGKLSPLYNQQLTVKKEDASNVISYAYAGLVKKGDIRRNVLKSNAKDASEIALSFFREEKDGVFMSALEKGFIQKYKNQDNIKNLLETGDSKLVYQSSSASSRMSSILGVGIDGKGLNFIGNFLEKLRDKVKTEENERIMLEKSEMRRRHSYNTYMVYEYLRNKIMTGQDDLSSYIGKKVNDLMTELKLMSYSVHSDFNVVKMSPFFRDWKYAQQNSDEKLTDLSVVLRKVYANEYNESIREKQREEILEQYAGGKFYIAQKEELKNRIYDLVSLGIIENIEIKPLVFLEEIKEKPYTKLFESKEKSKEKTEKKETEEMRQQARFLQEKVKRIVPLLELNKRQRFVENFADSKMDKKNRAYIDKLDHDQLRELKNAMREYLTDTENISAFMYLGYPKKNVDEDLEESSALKKDIYKIIKELKKTITVEKEKKPKNKKKTKTQEWKEKEEGEESEESEESEEEEYRPKSKKKQEMSETEDEDDVEEEEEDHENEDQEEEERQEDGEKRDWEDIEVEEKLVDPKKTPLIIKAFALFYKDFVSEFGNVKKEEAWDIWNSIPKEEKDEYISKGSLKFFNILPIPQVQKEEKKEQEPVSVIQINEGNSLSPYSLSFVVIDNFLFPSVMHYVVYRLYNSLEHSVLDSHNFIMRERDIALPREYTSYRDAKELFQMYHNEEGIYLRNILLPRTRSALAVKFSNLQMSQLLRVSYPNLLLYKNIILGENNQIGEMMMATRLELVSEHGPFTIEEYNSTYKVASVQEQEVEIPDMNKFTDKAKDILYVIDMYKKYTNKMPTMKFILNDLYHYNRCFKNHNLSYPPWFRKYTSDLNNKFNLADSDLKMLWNYFVSYNSSVESKLFTESVKNNIDQKILEKEINETEPCDMICVYKNFIKIVKSIKSVSSASLENCVLFVYHLVSVSNNAVDLKEMEKQTEFVQDIKKELGNNEAVSKQIAYLCLELMKERDMSRLLFFSELPKYEDLSDEEENDIIYEEESEEKDEDDIDREDYGDEEGDDEENEY